MGKKHILFALVILSFCASCGQTNQTDNKTGNADTMVIKQNKTDSATNSVSADTTKR